MASARQDVVVGRPLSPEVLDELGASGPFPEARADERPDGEWAHTYRIFTCHGYVNRRNDDHGFLEIERRKADGSGDFRLGVRQRILFSEGAVQELQADLICRHDRRATPSSWTLTVDFFGPDGSRRGDLSWRENGRVDGDDVEVERDGRRHRRPGSPRLASDWGLFDAVQRLPGGAEEQFDLLEGLSVLKPGHRLRHRGPVTGSWNGDAVEFEHLVQWGSGILPFEYYLDATRRLVLVTTLSRAYILDGAAERKTAETIDEARATARRRGR